MAVRRPISRHLFGGEALTASIRPELRLRVRARTILAFMQFAPTTIRPAEPTLDEGRIFARHLDAAADGLVSMLLGERMTDVIAEAFTQPKSEYSFENVLAAERDGRIVGMGAGFGVDARRAFSDAPLLQAQGFPRWRYYLMGLMWWPLFQRLSRVNEGEFYVLALSTDAEARGAGVGTALLNALENRARELGCQRLALDVDPKNERARRLYEHVGFAVESRWPGPKWLPTVLLRMCKPLVNKF